MRPNVDGLGGTLDSTLSRVAVIGLVALHSAIVACAIGRVDAVSHKIVPAGVAYFVFRNDSISLADQRIDQRISELIEHKMQEFGFRPAPDSDTADVLVLFEYTIGPGRTVTSGHTSVDFVSGGTQTIVSSSTSYPRKFSIAIVDAEESLASDQLVFLWQGEIRSGGASRNIVLLAPLFVDEIFERFNRSAESESFLGELVRD